MSINVTDGGAIERASKLLSEVPGGIEKALVGAVNHSAQKGKTQAVKEVRARYTAKAGDIRKTMKVNRASRSNIEAEIVSRGPVLGLSHYKYAPNQDTTGSNRQQIRVSIKREGGLKPLGNSFVWGGLIMERLGATSHPVGKMLGPSIPSIMKNQEIVDAVLEASEENVAQRLDHEVNRILKI